MHKISEKCRMIYLIAKSDAGLCDTDGSSEKAVAAFGGVRVYMNENSSELQGEEYGELYKEVLLLEAIAAQEVDFEVACDANNITEDEFNRYFEDRKKRWSDGFKLTNTIFHSPSGGF